MNTSSSHQRSQRLQHAKLYFVTASTLPGRHFETVLLQALQGGVDIVQLRDKSITDAELLWAAQITRHLCDRHGALFLLNDRPDLVEAADADGCHLGQDDCQVNAARELVGNDRLIGLSTHSPQQLQQAVGVDYVGVGPVHQTPTKPGREAVGLDLVRYAAGCSRLPWFAIGGIDTNNLQQVLAAGAERIAVVRAINEANNPYQASKYLKEQLTTANTD